MAGIQSLPAGRRRRRLRWVATTAVILMTATACVAGGYVPPEAINGSIGQCPVFPADNIWNTRVDRQPVAGRSAQYVASIGANAPLWNDFGPGKWNGSVIGMPYVVVPWNQPRVPVTFFWVNEADPGPYPIPANAPIEGTNNDHHVMVVDRDSCMLYEMVGAQPEGAGWRAGGGAIFNLRSNALRPDRWLSADAAGLPIFPGLVRYDEVASGSINHALRFTAPMTQNTYVWPGRHTDWATGSTDPNQPPMGQRFRLKANFDISGFSPPVQVILRALKTYGMMLADRGPAWKLSGAPDERWVYPVLQELRRVPGSAFEAVDVSGLMINWNSAQSRPG
jgi:hypothetical protein